MRTRRQIAQEEAEAVAAVLKATAGNDLSVSAATSEAPVPLRLKRSRSQRKVVAESVAAVAAAAAAEPNAVQDTTAVMDDVRPARGSARLRGKTQAKEVAPIAIAEKEILHVRRSRRQATTSEESLESTVAAVVEPVKKKSSGESKKPRAGTRGHKPDTVPVEIATIIVQETDKIENEFIENIISGPSTRAKRRANPTVASIPEVTKDPAPAAGKRSTRKTGAVTSTRRSNRKATLMSTRTPSPVESENETVDNQNGHGHNTVLTTEEAKPSSEADRQIAVNLLQNAYRGHLDRIRFLKIRKAVIVIQSVVRGWLCRKAAKDRADRQRFEQQRVLKLHSSAISLQKNARMWAARRRYDDLRRASVKTQSLWRMKTTRNRFKTARSAAVTIQKYTRGHFLRREYVRKRGALISIQNAWRGYAARKQYQSSRGSVIQLQSMIRCWLARKQLSRRRDAAILEEQRRQAESHARKEHAVVCMQRHYRGFKARKEFQQLREQRHLGAIKIQRFCRLCRAREAAKLIRRHQAATKVQSVVRGWLTRQNFGKYRISILTLQCHIRAHQQRMQFLKVRRAVITLQRASRFWHMRMTGRAQLEELRKEKALRLQEEEEKMRAMHEEEKRKALQLQEERQKAWALKALQLREEEEKEWAKLEDGQRKLWQLQEEEAEEKRKALQLQQEEQRAKMLKDEEVKRKALQLQEENEKEQAMQEEERWKALQLQEEEQKARVLRGEEEKRKLSKQEEIERKILADFTLQRLQKEVVSLEDFKLREEGGPAAIVIQRNFRGWTGRNEFKKLQISHQQQRQIREQAAITIQKHARGCLARRAYKSAHESKAQMLSQPVAANSEIPQSTTSEVQIPEATAADHCVALIAPLASSTTSAASHAPSIPRIPLVPISHIPQPVSHIPQLSGTPRRSVRCREVIAEQLQALREKKAQLRQRLEPNGAKLVPQVKDSTLSKLVGLEQQAITAEPQLQTLQGEAVDTKLAQSETPIVASAVDVTAPAASEIPNLTLLTSLPVPTSNAHPAGLATLSPGTIHHITTTNNDRNSGYKTHITYQEATFARNPGAPAPVSPSTRLKQRMEERKKNGGTWQPSGGETEPWTSDESEDMNSETVGRDNNENAEPDRSCHSPISSRKRRADPVTPSRLSSEVSERKRARTIRWQPDLVSCLEFDTKEQVVAVAVAKKRSVEKLSRAEIQEIISAATTVPVKSAPSTTIAKQEPPSHPHIQRPSTSTNSTHTTQTPQKLTLKPILRPPHLRANYTPIPSPELEKIQIFVAKLPEEPPEPPVVLEEIVERVASKIGGARGRGRGRGRGGVGGKPMRVKK